MTAGQRGTAAFIVTVELSPGQHLVPMPQRAEILHVEVIEGTPHLWARALPGAPTVHRYIAVYPSDAQIEGWPAHVGSYVVAGEAFHVFTSGEVELSPRVDN